MPRPKWQPNPLIRRYLKTDHPARTDAKDLGELKAVQPTSRRGDGAPLLGDNQVYVVKYGTKYHTAWCKVVADKWDQAPRSLLVTLLADVGARTRCKDCDRHLTSATVSSPMEHKMHHPPTVESPPAAAVIPLRVVGVAHGILFLAAGPEYRGRLKETAVEPATPLFVDGRRDGVVMRLDAARDEPLLVVQLDPRAIFWDGPYQVRLRRPLQRSATKPYAIESVEPAPSDPGSP
ncbi:hypothetical protein [Arthrobacter sp. ISL-30]|uniref:hypothetical protein n=1 Tax=Arthrobacter sp. ISL-30 TaxID=2819109 RepID=UPI001BEC8FEE|nr:hypothetical protein [Arthrobacter sp. ISL-30]MBT2512967.1 hypothetical protein [Arthrobacter sp. ISL-30]